MQQSERFWVGIGADKTIEQIRMISLKTAGGLTIGGSMDEAHAVRWCLAMPTMSAYSQAIEVAIELCYVTNEQHIDLSEAMIKRDHKHIENVLAFLNTFSPYNDVTDGKLCNIGSGVVADSIVNVHDLVSVGNSIVGDMDGKEIFFYSVRRINKAKTLSEVSKMKYDDDTERSIEPGLLFQRLLVVANTGNEDVDFDDDLRYELCTFTPALFENCLRN